MRIESNPRQTTKNNQKKEKIDQGPDQDQKRPGPGIKEKRDY